MYMYMYVATHNHPCFLEYTAKVEKQKKKSKRTGEGKGSKVGKVMVNEEKVDLLLEMLRGADVTLDEDTEGETVKELEGEND